MLIKVIAGTVLLVLLFTVFRFAMGLRAAKMARLQARRDEEARGRRVVAEIPVSDAGMVLLLEDDEAFHWGTESVRKAEIVGARLLLNGAIVREFAARGLALPPLVPVEEFEGRERWEVGIYLRGSGAVTLPCGTLREGVSREIGALAFEAIRASVAGPSQRSSSCARGRVGPPASS
jgi:hypothetical protein